MKEETGFDPSQHSFTAQVTYDGARLAVHAVVDGKNITTIGGEKEKKNSHEHADKQILDIIQYPKEIFFFNTLSQTSLVEPFIQEVKARAPEAEDEIYPYIGRILTYGHKIGRELFQSMTHTMGQTQSVEELYQIIEQSINQEKERREYVEKCFTKYTPEIDKKFPELKKYFEQDYTAENNYIRIEKEDLRTELLLFGMENYIKRIASIDPGFIHRN